MKVAIVGVGVMGEALLSGLLKGNATDDIVVAERREDRAAAITEKYGVPASDLPTAIAGADTVLVIVKPQDMSILLRDLAGLLRPDALVISLAAGITTEFIAEHLPLGHPIVRAMPNTPAVVDEGITAIAGGSSCQPAHLREARRILESVGEVVEVPEHYLDAVTAISGSGPAYIFYMVEAMIDAGVLLGLPRELANELVTQTLLGAAVMLKETGQHPTVLRENVSSPAGTTVSAIRQLDEHKVRAAFMAAMEAARDRSQQLASGS